jgi:putative hydrolase of the HAD superfamily
MRYKVAILDLDNCLLDARSVGALFEPAFEAIRHANQGTLAPEVLEQAIEQCWFTAFDLVAERFGFSDRMRDAGLQQFRRMRVTSAIQGYPDIALLPRVAMRRYLVTSGFRHLQESKITALGIRPWFDHVLIDDVDEATDAPAHSRGKLAVFRRILEMEGCQPSEVLVIGDNPLSELGAGCALGATTVQTVRPGVTAWDLADHRVTGLGELLELLSKEAGATHPGTA